MIGARIETRQLIAKTRFGSDDISFDSGLEFVRPESLGEGFHSLRRHVHSGH